MLGNFCRENRYWPSFRTISHTLTEVQILEPGFYAKIENNLFLDGEEFCPGRVKCSRVEMTCVVISTCHSI